MAPPPSANLPLGERILALAQTLQFAWFSGYHSAGSHTIPPQGSFGINYARSSHDGWETKANHLFCHRHLVLILSIIRYTLSYITFNSYSRWARFTYRVSFLSAALTYGIVVYKTWRARQKVGARSPGGAIGILSDENVQYLGMLACPCDPSPPARVLLLSITPLTRRFLRIVLALVWLLAPQYPLALLPYGIYSVFHVATYLRSNVIPTIQPNKAAAGAKPQGNPLSDAIGAFVKSYYDASMAIVAALEISLWGRIFLSAVLFQSRSWILLGLYTAFLRARFSQSTHVQNSFNALELRVDSLVGAQGTPPAARSVWEGVKGGARQFHAATDLSKYTNGSGVPKKTS
ncbi:hypothetical protein F5Y03DRAFT_396829 [Xylaria venustula]|nr:hypothetical protein F5Y03DRAFT_396829 [Xylaria venustula]